MSDQIVEDLIKKAAEKEAKIGKIEGYSPQTNMMLPNNRDGGAGVALNTVGSADDLVFLLSKIRSTKNDFEETAKSIGAKVKPFKWGGYTYGDWEADIKARINRLALQSEKASLRKLRNRLDDLMSPEQKRELELKKIAAELDEED